MPSQTVAARPSRSRAAVNRLIWGVLISLAIHALGGSFIKGFPDAHQSVKVDHTPLTLDRRPKPRVARKPHALPRMAAQPAPRRRPPVVPHATSHRPSLAQQPVPAASSLQTENGPVGPSQSGPSLGTSGGSEPAAPTLPAPASPPKPACSNPNAEARAVSKVTPDYPERALGASGEAAIRVELDVRGNVLDASVYRSSGNAVLDQAALSAARATTYSPEIRDCERIAGNYVFVATFSQQ